MATKSEIERLAVVETKVDDILKHLDSIEKKLDSQENKFAAKWVQQVVGGLIGLILTSVFLALLALVVRR